MKYEIENNSYNSQVYTGRLVKINTLARSGCAGYIRDTKRSPETYRIPITTGKNGILEVLAERRRHAIARAECACHPCTFTSLIVLYSVARRTFASPCMINCLANGRRSGLREKLAISISSKG